jgi:hypothetical protein
LLNQKGNTLSSNSALYCCANIPKLAILIFL